MSDLQDRCPFGKTGEPCNKIVGNRNTGLLKGIGLISMTVDHVGRVLFPQLVWMQIAGRLAYPLFAYCAVIAATYTHDKKRYFMRLLVCALISQPFYVFALSRPWWQLNTVFDLLFGVMAVVAVTERNQLWFLTACLGSVICSYGIYGIALMLAFFLLMEKGTWLPAAAVLLLPAILWRPDLEFAGLRFSMQGLAVVVLPLLFVPMERTKFLPRAIFYVWYPLHLGILTVLS